MAADSENDLSNVSVDDEHSLDSLTKVNKNHDKSITRRPKPDLKCVVCGDHALGYNFDAIACESCKAFFRRTAIQLPEKLKCRGNGHCEVTVENRKRCKKCRLEKCVKMGMRKEWILSDEQYVDLFLHFLEQRNFRIKSIHKFLCRKQKKKSQIETNRRLKRICEDAEKPSHHRVKHSKAENTIHLSKKSNDILSMTEKDCSRLDQIQFAYNESIIHNKVIGVPSFPATQHIYSTLELIRLPTYLASIRLITFIKNIPEFELIDLDDRILLVKYNLLAVVFMHIVLLYDSNYDTYHEFNTEDPVFQGNDWIRVLGKDFYRELTNFATKLLEVVEKDHVIIKTFLLLILLTKGFCAYDIAHEPSLKNHSVVLKVQNFYLETLYKYCIKHYGLTKTESLFTNLLPHLFSVQHLAVHLKNYVHHQIDASQLSPLMQSVLQLADSPSST